MSINPGKLRRLPEITCLFPKTVEEALRLIDVHAESARVMAGGTYLLNKMKRRYVVAKYLIDLKEIADLNFIAYDGEEGLRVGAVTTLSRIVESPVVRELYPILADAAALIGSPQIRNIASMAGNLCSAVSSADSAPPLIALAAQLKIVSLEKERTVLVEDFFTGPHQTVLCPDELVTEILVPPPPAGGRGVYLKPPLRAEGDLSIAGVAVFLSRHADNICHDARIALGAVAPAPMRAWNAENVLKKKPMGNDLIEKVARIASEEAKPIDDIRSSADYRKQMVRVLTKRAIQKCLQMNGG